VINLNNNATNLASSLRSLVITYSWRLCPFAFLLRHWCHPSTSLLVLTGWPNTDQVLTGNVEYHNLFNFFIRYLRLPTESINSSDSSWYCLTYQRSTPGHLLTDCTSLFISARPLCRLMSYIKSIKHRRYWCNPSNTQKAK
jgi:hypothetical protein